MKKTNDKAKVKGTGAGTIGKSTGKRKQSTKAHGHSSVAPVKGSKYPSVSDTANLASLELQQLNHTGMPSKLKLQRGGSSIELPLSRIVLNGHTSTSCQGI